MILNESLKRNDERAVSVAVTHVLAIGITTILIVSLMTAAGGMAENEQDRSARQQLKMIGSSMANQIEQADKLGRRGANVTVRKEFEETISGKYYSVDLETGNDCNAATIDTNACLVLNLTSSSVSTTVGVSNQSPVTFRDQGSGTVKIVAEPGNAASNTDNVWYDWTTSDEIGIGDYVYQLPPTQGGGAAAQDQPPEANLSMDPEWPNLGNVIIFNASNSSDDNEIVEYRWNFTGGQDADNPGKFNETTESPVLSVPTGIKDKNGDVTDDPLWAGRFKVNLTVVDDAGQVDTETVNFGVAGLVVDGQATAFDSKDGYGDKEEWVGGSFGHWEIVDTWNEDTVPGGVLVPLYNHHESDIYITKMSISPDDTDIDRIDDDPTDDDDWYNDGDSKDDEWDDDARDAHEVIVWNGKNESFSSNPENEKDSKLIGSWDSYAGDSSNGLEFSDNVIYLDDNDWDSSSYAYIGSDGTGTLQFIEFRKSDPSDKYDSINMSGKSFSVRIRYKIEKSGSENPDMGYVARLNVTPETPWVNIHSADYHESTPEGSNVNLQIKDTKDVDTYEWEILTTSDGVNRSNVYWNSGKKSDKASLNMKSVSVSDSDQFVVVEYTAENSHGTETIRWYINIKDTG
jgi:hypothetical protein